MCSGEDPCWCDETAPTEVGPIALDADLPGPLAFQGVLPTNHPVEHPWVPAGWENMEALSEGRACHGFNTIPNPRASSHFLSMFRPFSPLSHAEH